MVPALRATYRLQFSDAFRFEDGRRIVPYLAALGISHVYASPLLMARPGSTHGYDIVDHNRLNPEIGDRGEFEAFVRALRQHGMGLILDFVPNHMGIGPDNPWWMDVLEWGRASPCSRYFDIDWRPAEPTLAGKVLLPVLGDHYGAALARGELVLRFDADEGSFLVSYFDTPFPINPRSYSRLLQAAAGRAGNEGLARLATAFGQAMTGRSGKAGERRRRDRIAALKGELAGLCAADAAARGALLDEVGHHNGNPGHAASFDRLHALLEKQAYRLAFWRVAAHELNYRRFFDINDLAGLRMERPELFEASHALVGRLVRDGRIDGLRLDHVDGLRDPKAYVARLQALAADRRAEAGTGHGRGAGARGAAAPLYVLVEKILAAHETLRRDWAVSGTSGYDFMAAVNLLFADPRGERPLKRCYARFIAGAPEFPAMRVEAKRLIMEETLGSELNVLANLFNRLAKQSRMTRDYSLPGLRRALIEVVAHFPVYRTYVTGRQTTAEDRRDLEWAVSKARQAAPGSDTSIYDFLLQVLTLDLLKGERRAHRRGDAIDAALKFQQYSGPVMAKAVEDTAFYRYVCLVSQNEVGGDPSRFYLSPAAFHEANRRRLAGHPVSMLATATHDHKRGEDLRARLNVLTERPDEWGRRVRRWSILNKRKRRLVDEDRAPSRNDEYLLYQTLAGAWPYALNGPAFERIDGFRDRIAAYMQKAAREAKLRTSWASPNAEYEAALAQFTGDILDPKLSRPFLDDLCSFVQDVSATGAVNGLAQTVLKLTSPGIPDFYQGTELWDLSLVDPDNRRPVDYETRGRHLSTVRGGIAPETLLAAWRDGRIKQYVVQRILDLRRERPALFTAADYRSIDPAGKHAARVLAFARIHADGGALVAAVPRLVWPLMQTATMPLPDGWSDTCLALPERLHGRSFLEVLSGRRMACEAGGALGLATLFRDFPVAVLAG